MAKGTRIRGLDERLGTQDFKLGEISDELTKIRGEHNQKFEDMDSRMERIEVRMTKVDTTLGELKQLILNLAPAPRSSVETTFTSALITGKASSHTPILRSETLTLASEQVSHSNHHSLVTATTIPLISTHTSLPNVSPPLPPSVPPYYYAPPSYSTISHQSPHNNYTYVPLSIGPQNTHTTTVIPNH